MEVSKYSIVTKGRIYLGHPQAEKLYLTNMVLKCLEGKWDLVVKKDDDIFKEVLCVHSAYKQENLDFSDIRSIKDCSAILISDSSFYDKLKDNDLENILTSCMKYRPNPNLLTFEDYTEKILGDRLESLEGLDALSPEDAIKYVRYRDKYDADLKYSNKDESYWSSVSRENLFLFAYEKNRDFKITLAYSEGKLVGLKINLS